MNSLERVLATIPGIETDYQPFTMLLSLYGASLLKTSAKEYYRNPELSSKVLRDGWLNTGDVCSRDSQGLMHIKGRSDDLIIKAGMNIYPAEIENQLKESSIFSDIVAYGVFTQSGQEISIDAVLAEGAKHLTVRDVFAICGKTLPAYQLPATINLVEALEKNASGKTLRPRTKLC